MCGWIGARRDHGKLIFIDIRDKYGLTQAVFIPKESGKAYEAAQDLRDEFVIKIKGIVNARPKGMINPKLKTGEVELLVQELEILNPSLTPPFQINPVRNNISNEVKDEEVSEELRFQYRYLDLRRPSMQTNIFLRHTIIKAMREFLNSKEFIEVETPILTKSTPEGARDYLVPSRLNPGKFYALPQSPQLFKQLLMVSGFERYYQVARCFRDEDLRADRQPEFTQLDIEMSFISEDDIFSLIEGLMQKVLKETLQVDIATPFERLTHKEAMAKYNTDKPNIKKADERFNFLWVTEFPLFKFNDEERRWESEHHPFTAPCEQDLAFMEASPERVRSRAYDLVMNGVELGSGSIRIHSSELQSRIFKIIGLTDKEAQARFGFLLEAFKYGAPPHGGIALGIDRFASILAGRETIRDCIAFPKTQKAICMLTQAPSDVSRRQLDELGLTSKK